MKGSDRGKISGAPPAPGDAPRGAARRTMLGASATSCNTAVRPGRGVPPGCPWAGHLPCRPSAACPSARPPRAFSNLLRPRVQRAESLPAARASDAKASEGRCWNHRMCELTKSGARPAPSLRARAAGVAWRCWPSLKGGPAFLRSAAWGFGLPRISGAPPAPGNAPRGAARRRCSDISDEPQQSGAPQALRPAGLPLGRAYSMLALRPMPPAWVCRAASNPPRPRGQRAERPWVPEPQPCSPGAARAALPYLRIGSRIPPGRDGGTGRRTGLKIPHPQGYGGSIPPPGTTSFST
jgi:hypothetical protein